MDCQSNSFESLIQSFKSMCSVLEANAESALMDVEKQCKEEFFESAKTLEKFNELTLGISETCKEILNCSEVLNVLTERSNSEAAINVPYELHSDLVKSINALYNMHIIGREAGDEKLISEKNKQLVGDLIKECEKNIYNLKELQSAVVDARATFE